MLPRRRYRLQVVLREGVVCVRKRFPRLPAASGLGPLHWLWELAGLRFHTEAAALRRLHGCAQVPQLRGVDVASHSVYMDYVAGESLRHALAGRVSVYDLDLAADPSLRRLTTDESQRREAELSSRLLGEAYGGQVRDLVRAINLRGVALQDIKPGNAFVGARTRRLYWLDFEAAVLASQSGWEQALAEQHRLLDLWFGTAARNDVLAV